MSRTELVLPALLVFLLLDGGVEELHAEGDGPDGQRGDHDNGDDDVHEAPRRIVLGFQTSRWLGVTVEDLEPAHVQCRDGSDQWTLRAAQNQGCREYVIPVLGAGAAKSIDEK